MKILILDGSPHQGINGDIANLLLKFKYNLSLHFQGLELVTVRAYYDDVKPCYDCRKCWETGMCVINDALSKAQVIMMQ